MKGEMVEVLAVPHRIVGSLSGEEALQFSEGEVVYLVEEEDSCWA